MDPVTGLSAQLLLRLRRVLASRGRGNITVTNPNYQTYKGVDITANKRFSNRWQCSRR